MLQECCKTSKKNNSWELKTKKLYSPFLWMGFNCLKARATSRRQFTFYHQIPRNSWHSVVSVVSCFYTEHTNRYNFFKKIYVRVNNLETAIQQFFLNIDVLKTFEKFLEKQEYQKPLHSGQRGSIPPLYLIPSSLKFCSSPSKTLRILQPLN